MDRITTLTAAGGPSFQVRYRRWKNHPGPGVDFPDTSPFATDGATMRHVVDALGQTLPSAPDVIGGIDIGGLGFAGALAQRSGAGFLDIRKVDSIRADVIRSIMANYELGDGVAVSRAHRIAGRTVTILDDCLMTGGIALAAVELVRRLGARCVTALFVFELDGMGGRALLERTGVGVHALGTLSQAEPDEPA